MLVGEIFFILIVIWTSCILGDRWDDQATKLFVEEYIPKLQQNLRRADDDSDENYITSKTIKKNNRHYDVHLIKLRNVNGLKMHNLIVKERHDDNPLIYVINPVETKIPHAFVSQKEFKDILNNRVKKQRMEVYKKEDPLLPLTNKTINSTYWTKITWSKPTLRSVKFHYQNLFKRRQQNPKLVVTTKNMKTPNKLKNVSKLRYKGPPVPYKRIRTGNRKAKVHKTNDLRSNKTSNAKTNINQYIRNNRTSKKKTIKLQYMRSNKTSKTIRNKAITSKNNGTLKAKTIYLRTNRSITAKRNKIKLRNLSTKPIVQTVSHMFNNDQNISITEKISKATITGKQIIETIERQTTKDITTEKSTTENELPLIKSEVANTTELFTTKKQLTEEVTLEQPTTSDITTEKLKTDEETKIEPGKSITENTENSNNEGDTKEVPTNSEITTEKLTTEDKTTTESNNTETVNTDHSKAEEPIATEKTAETPTTEDTTKPNDNTESVNTEIDLTTDQLKDDETTQQKRLPFRTTVVKRTTKKTITTRSRLSRPLVFMGDMGNGNSWK